MFAVFNNLVVQSSGEKDPTSLDNLHDLAVPSSLPFWPPAPGWYVLLIGLLVLAVWILLKAVRTYHRNAYRRAALVELEQIRENSADKSQRTVVVMQLNQLLKRVALVRWDRRQMAGSSGHDWLDFLNRTGKTKLFTQSQIDALRDSAYSSRIREAITAQQLNDLIDQAELWIRNHQFEAAAAGNGEDSSS